MKRIKEAHELYTIPAMEHEPGSIGYLEKIFIAQLILISRAEFIVETGSFQGQTTKFLSQFLIKNNLKAEIFSFDVPEVIELILVQDSSLASAENITFVKGRLPETLIDCLKKAETPLDFALIDSEHSYKQVMDELTAIHSYLREGAYIFCHDYLEFNDTYRGVVEAVNQFSKAYNYDLLPLSGEKMWGSAILRKPHTTLACNKDMGVISKLIRLFKYAFHMSR